MSGGYFALLGVTPTAGRAIGPEDDRVPNGHPVAMISDGYWARRFGRASSTIGRVIAISGTPFTVIGITPPEFFGVEVGTAPDIFVPVLMQPAVMPTFENLLDRPIIFRTWLRVLARLRSGVTRTQATAALQPLIAAQFPVPDNPAGNPRLARMAAILEGLRPVLTPAATGLSDLRQQFSRPLFILMTVVGILLLIACANTANLLLARATARRREFAMRLALGAGRWRLLRQLLVESVLLALLGGVAGVVLAGWATELLVAFMSLGRTPIVLDLSPDLRVLAFTVAVSVLTGIVFGTAPAVRATGIDLIPALKGVAGLTGRRGLGLDRLLAVSQIALSLVLLIGAGLFVRSLAALNERDAGFRRESVLIARVEPQGSDQRNIEGTSARLDRIYRDLIRRVEAVPGVQSASLAQFTPTNPVPFRGQATAPSGETIGLHVPMVYPGYFETMGMRLVAGRDFGTRDLDLNVRQREQAAFQQRVAVVNETFARRVYPGTSAVGRPCDGAAEADPSQPCEIIGVVQDSAYADFTGEVRATRYQPFLQTRTGRGQMALHVRLVGDAASLIPTIRREVSEVDATLPLFEVRTLADEVDAALVQERLVATLASVFGLLALLLASVGLYGLLAFAVVRRTAEIGLRMALGAGQGVVVWMVMRDALGIVVAGGVVGVAVGFGAARVAGSQISGLLFGIETVDPVTFTVAPLVLAATAFLAAYLRLS